MLSTYPQPHIPPEDIPFLHAWNIVTGADATLERMFKTFPTFRDAWHATITQLIASGITPKRAHFFAKKRCDIQVEKEWSCISKLCAQHNGHIIVIGDAIYPQMLATIPDPPPILYARGNIDCLRQEHILSIVGTRRPTSYGREVVRTMIPQFVMAGWMTVSGCAFGIDVEVHIATFTSGGKTLAVFGSSIMPQEVTPRMNAHIAEKIVQHDGLLLSEFAPGTKVLPHHFPQRNRIIAGLTHTTLVIEADAKSGALITARCAAEYGRDVYAIPGSIFSPRSCGTNQLIANGAMPLCSPSTIIGNRSSSVHINHHPFDQKILDATRTPRTIEDIAMMIHIPLSDVVARCTILALDGHLQDCGNQTYCTKQ